ncbi:hypothetical protein DENIS_3475 [Desulfonema ishimotonii]|uniref:Uncharacterized protein n=1 Tax=Desulfonema ishimotonii TaxID=45657 RepID=A0A401FZZ1_9BACT|nr:hypothetical protein [Desulfonema ishimotonii]GBC62503.1 hypothetical protein DENIS_3475 [Desulfonema ishimotonii]
MFIGKKMNFSIRDMDSELWQTFRKLLFDEIDPATGRPISANKKVKQLVQEYVESRLKEEKQGNIKKPLSGDALDGLHQTGAATPIIMKGVTNE